MAQTASSPLNKRPALGGSKLPRGLRELKKIKDAWPDLHYYRTVTGALLLSPSPPRIPPAQLRLVE